MKRYIIKCLALLCAALFFAACGAKETQTASGTVAPVSVSIPQGLMPASLSKAESVAPYQSPIDFFGLMAQAPDVCAWIKVDGTNIDHPVTRAMDNTYYLTHDPYGNYYAGGSLFLDMINATDFSGPVTLMYGHVMPDDTLFSQLHLYKDAEFFKENNEIIIDLFDNRLTYRVFAAFPNDAANLLYEKDYGDADVFGGLLEHIAAKEEQSPDETNIDMSEVDTGDNLLLLSTCDNEGSSRYIVAARLTEKAVE